MESDAFRYAHSSVGIYYLGTLVGWVVVSGLVRGSWVEVNWDWIDRGWLDGLSVGVIRGLSF